MLSFNSCPQDVLSETKQDQIKREKLIQIALRYNIQDVEN
jgi:hypothetical protein